MLLTFVSTIFSLTVSEIKSDNKYFFGEVTEAEEIEDYDDAKDKALARLSGNISVTVSSDFKNMASEVNGKVDESVKSIINTYTGITLKNLTPKKSVIPVAGM